MSKRKGVSAEEKKNRLLDLFYDKKDVFNYKELEKAAFSEKGINSQSLKDVLNALIGDNYVESSKIGTSVYYWAFPSEALKGRNKKMNELQASVEEDEKYFQDMRNSIAEAKKIREDTPHRRALQSEYELLTKEKESITKELVAYRDSDPDVIQAEKKDIEETIEGVNRWTDNVDSLQSWVKNKFGMSNADFSTQTGIPDEWEYLDVEQKKQDF